MRPLLGGGPFLGAHSWGGDSHAGAACLRDQHFEQTRVSGPVYQGGGRAPCWPLFMNHSLVLSKGRPWGSTAHTARGLENRPPASGDGGLACGSCPLAPWPVGVMTCGPGWGLVFGASDTTPLPPPPRRYPLYQLGNPQLRVFRTNFFIQLVRPGTAQPEDTVQFRIPME